MALTRALDFNDSAAAVSALEAEDEAGPIGLALFVAGRGDIRPDDVTVEPAEQIIRLGVVNFVTPAALASVQAQRMAQRGEGQIVLIGSAAAFHALPFAAGYAASKAGLARFAEALRLGMKQHGVQVLLVSPGFIDTAAQRQRRGAKPFMLQPADAAARISRAIEQGRGQLVMPWPFAALRVLDRLLPAALRDRLLLRLRP